MKPVPSPSATQPRRRLSRADRIRSFTVAAAELVRSEGVGAVTMERVAAEVGVNKAMVYRYWKNREDLLISVFEDEMADMGRAAADAAGRYDDFAGWVRASLEVMFDIVGDRGVVLAILRSPSATGDLETHRRAIYDGIEITWADTLTATFGVPTDQARVATAIFVAGLDALFRLTSNGADKGDLIDTYVELCVDAAAGQARRHGRATARTPEPPQP